MQIIGNLCLSLAGLLYLLPLQQLLFEFARKKDDGGGMIAGLLILAPLWLLLQVGVSLATVQGGLDWLPLRRGAWLHGLVVAATLALAVVSFLSLATLARPSWTTRLTLGAPLYLFPPLTIAFVAAVLNPALGARLPLAALRWCWVLAAAACLAGCGLTLTYNLATMVGRRGAQLVHSFGSDRKLEQEHLALVAALDPQRDAPALLGYTTGFHAESVRRLAIQRLRTHPQLVEAVLAALGERDPSRALEFLVRVELTPEERARLAAPTRAALFAFAAKVQEELRYTPPGRRRLLRSWGRPLYRELATRFAGTGVDFAPALVAFEGAFTPAEE